MTRIILSMNEDGVSIIKAPADAYVEIRDYDVPDDWDGDVFEDEEGDKFDRIILQGIQPIKAKFVQEVEVLDPDTGLAVDVAIIKLETGGMIGIDSSYISQEGGPLYSPFDEGVELDYAE